MPDNELIYSVSQLCRETRLILEGHFLTLTIEGEISNLARPASGHIYFTLKDDKAQVQCAMFKPQLRKIGFKAVDGMHVILKARVSLYEARGNFQLIAEHMQSVGDGVLRERFEQLKSKLLNDGLFDDALKKPLPTLPSKIGVITSTSGAAIHDVLTVLNSRFPALPVLIYPVTVQGEVAKHEIAEAVSLANARADCDVIILARGGGSLEDLWAFNEEIVARAIHQSDIPIISAVGHETDITIADFVADYRAPTPSAAAETISPDQEQWFNHLNYLSGRLSDVISSKLAQKYDQLDRSQQLLKRAHPKSQLQMHTQRVDYCQTRLTQLFNKNIQTKTLQLSTLNSTLLGLNPNHVINDYQKRFSAAHHQLFTLIQRQLHNCKIRFAQCSKGLETLSPLATLSRGYSLTQHSTDGSIIKSTQQVNLGDKLNIQLSDGSLQACLEGINEDT